MGVLLSIAALAGLVWFWADSTRAREQVLKRAGNLCDEMGVQLLDQSVELARLKLARGAQGQLCVRRWYAFEYSIDGTDRWQGTAVVGGYHVECVHLEHPHGPVIVKEATRLEV
jgi:hypothetical protein